MQISSYKIGIKFHIDPKEMRALDRQMKMLEARFKKFGAGLNKLINFKIGKFDVNQQELNRTMRRAFELTSARTAFNLDNFRVDQNALNRSVAAALRRATAAANGNVRVNATGTPGDRLTGRHAVAAGGVGGIAARMYGPAIALGFGGYGLARTNRLNQEVISAQLTTQAVTEAAGLQGQGPAAFDWLRQQGNRIGFSYMDQAQDYNNFLSNSLGAGMSLQGSQDIYLGFAEYARAMGITPARNKLVMNALSQMMGKGTVSMEELRRQMAESMPGTMDVFAQAYAEMTGSGLQGQEALSSLYDAIPTGKVKSAEILPIVQRILRERAAPKLDVAMKTSQAQQARFQNTTADMAILASNSGLEAGFSRLFRALNDGLKEAGPMIESLARGFDNVTKGVGSALLVVQSFQRFFQGRDSAIGDMLFPDEQSREKAFIWLDATRAAFSGIGDVIGMIVDGWKMLFGLINVNSLLSGMTKVANIITNLAGALVSLSKGDFGAALEQAKAAGASFADIVTAPGKAGVNAVLGVATEALGTLDPRVSDPSATAKPVFKMPWEGTYDPAGYAAKYKGEQKYLGSQAASRYDLPGVSQPLAQGQKAIDLKIDMNVDIKAANPEDFNKQFQKQFTSVIQETMLQYSEKE